MRQQAPDIWPKEMQNLWQISSWYCIPMKDLVFEEATGPTVGSASSTPSPYLNWNPRLGAGSKSKPDSNLELTAKIPSCFPSGNSILVIVSCVYVRVFQMWHFVKKKNCDASTIPSRAYINHIQKNFFPRTSLEGRPTWSKIGHPAVSICRKNLFFNNNTTPVNSLRGSQERLQHFFCSNTLPFFATDTYKLVAQGSLFIWVYSDYLSFSI